MPNGPVIWPDSKREPVTPATACGASDACIGDMTLNCPQGVSPMGCGKSGLPGSAAVAGHAVATWSAPT